MNLSEFEGSVLDLQKQTKVEETSCHTSCHPTLNQLLIAMINIKVRVKSSKYLYMYHKIMNQIIIIIS